MFSVVSSERSQMESNGTRFAPAIVMFFLACVAVGQSVSPEPTGRTPVVHAIDCSHPEPWDGGFTLYQDKVDGFHFMYPSILNREASLVFTDQPCGNFFHSGEIINMEVNLPSAYMEPVVSQYRRDSGVSVATQVYNQLKWVTYSLRDGWNRAPFGTASKSASMGACIHRLGRYPTQS
jgi:hypothetical protein